MGGMGAVERPTGDDNGSENTVLVADRGRAFAEALAGLLNEAGLNAIATAYDEAAMACRRLRPTTLLLDGDPPVADATAIAEAARSARSGVRILLLVGDDDRGQARTVAAVCARGVVSRQSGAEDVIAAVHGAPAGRSNGGRGRAGTRRTRNGGALSRLTPREIQVLRELMAGAPSATIAGTLGISPHTVRTHIQNIFAKLAVSTRLEAAALAREAGLRPQPLEKPGEAAASGGSR